MPHNGCPCDCSFCNQNRITGIKTQPDAVDVKAAVEKAVGSALKSETEIAFFGGSFTAIDREYMISLLSAAKEMIEKYSFKGIRISTRPDVIDEEILLLLKEYRVTAIELGAQSMCDEVLAANRRGHLSGEVIWASELIKSFGFELGLQMMTGLYKDTDERAIETAGKIIALKPQTVRIYPTIVLKDTHLEELMEKGVYKPQTLEQAIELVSKLIPMFEDNGIKVIRVGLHAEEELESGMVAGPYHPAFKELCMSRIFLKRLLEQLLSVEKSGKIKYNVLVNTRSLSVAKGQKKSNLNKLNEMGFEVSFFCNDNIKPGEFIIKQAN